MFEPLKSGDMLENTYEIIRLMYRRQKVTCYSAQDAQRLNYIIKEYVLPSNNPEIAGQLKAYIHAQADKLQDYNNIGLPVIQQLIDLDNRVYVVFQNPEGRTLREFVDKSRMMLTGDLIKGWLGQVGIAMINLHREQPPIVLGTLNPDNITVTNLGKAKIGDMGDEFFFPPVKEDPEYHELSLPFFAPEQLMGEPPSSLSDIYALGAICYYCFNGNLPALDIEQIKSARYNPSMLDNTLAPQSGWDVIPDDVASTIKKAMQFRPRNRFLSVEDFLDQLLGKEGAYDLARIEISPQSLEFTKVKKGEILSGQFKAKNTGRGLLNATVAANQPWIKVCPTAFVSNDESIRFWIDSSDLSIGGRFEGKIEVAGKDDHAEFFLSIETMASVFNRLPNLVASVLIMLYMYIPIILVGFFIFGLFNYGIMEVEHFYQAQLRGFSANDTMEKLRLLSTVKIPAKYIFNGRIAQLFFLLFPFLVPYYLSSFYAHLPEQRAKYVWVFYLIAMFMPIILLNLALTIFVPLRILLKDPGIKCFYITNSMYSFMLINLVTGIFLLVPPERRKAFSLYAAIMMLAYVATLVYYVLL